MNNEAKMAISRAIEDDEGMADRKSVQLLQGEIDWSINSNHTSQRENTARAWTFSREYHGEPTSYAMQCRVTTENPALDFRPDTGTIDVFRMPAGFGIRLGDGPGFPGAKDYPPLRQTLWRPIFSLLVKITAKARNRKEAVAKLKRALREFRVRGVTTNKSFLLNMLNNEEFMNGEITTGFIAANPDLMLPLKEKDRAQKLLAYM
ncbi:hypothetical protein THAOC_01842 [Thalassiosira oceanica]|uniref:Biotin carboxylation domain-containing protein n=1 Tax=Thalassiosira oceanica TaxID=159749 RepID=K0TCD8_THAOC|nr:hypothetical protein THAOC_01842 [Thalassiosira oceanica]|eukprot:EJK76398.1 hypothetical protein THAOC_01842 [Thalassiosira oceanica]